MCHLERRGENHPVADKPSAKINPERLKGGGAGTRQPQLVGPGSTNGQKGMSGAESLVLTIISSGVETCFTNPGTSEMHFVAALDRIPGIRCVLGLFEGVATGAADGYARIARKPAATLLHCGPGLANGLANFTMHNVRECQSSTSLEIWRPTIGGLTRR